MWKLVGWFNFQLKRYERNVRLRRTERGQSKNSADVDWNCPLSKLLHLRIPISNSQMNLFRTTIEEFKFCPKSCSSSTHCETCSLSIHICFTPSWTANCFSAEPWIDFSYKPKHSRWQAITYIFFGVIYHSCLILVKNTVTGICTANLEFVFMGSSFHWF